MSKDFQALVAVVFVVALISAVLAYWRAQTFATTEDLASKSLSAIRRQEVLFFAVFIPILVGVISFFAYRYLRDRSPDSAQTTWLLITVAIAVIFTVLAAVVFKMRAFTEFIALHVLHVAAFGAVLPRLMGK